MQVLAISLIAFFVWTLVLVLITVSWRGLILLAGKKRINEFPSGERHGSDSYWRVIRAHANAVENLVLFAALVGAAGLTEQLHPGTLGGIVWLPLWGGCVVGARVLQSIAHVSSSSQLAVSVRFVFFFAQLIAFAVLASALVLRLLA